MTTRFRPGALAWAVAATTLLAACGPSPPPPAAPAQPPVAMPPPAPVAPPAPPPAPMVVLPDMNLAAGPIYRCAIGGDSTPITYDPKVESLCRRHPEMGPCQFERDACRARGGRVYTSAGEEVTTAVEAKYDERVRRVRFSADGGT